ncbi:hypothetical protein [Rhodoferax antarcticus]|uniref:hypothetical protein n=1 Tax=Rhodoferax antarcticus TaxID=81479 RepID=UPI000AE123CB|nr:hypothetical protein [Rhodoferax antarcticus]
MNNQTGELTMKLPGAVSASRHFFEDDSVFKGENVQKFLIAYEKAASRAANSAKRAIESNSLEKLRAAQWDSAVVQTLECVLECFEHTNDTDEFACNEEMTLPEHPNFASDC